MAQGRATTPKPLIIAEKPSSARAIAEALGGFRRGTHYMESEQYLLSWAVGHLVELLEPEDYHPRWRRWSLESLPILPARFQLKVARRTAQQFKVLQKLVGQASSLINACDAGREGELIFRFIVEALGVELPMQRLWVSSLTPEAIRAGFRELRPAAEYERLYQSALCRARGDWLMGMNGTRAFTTAFGELLSVGRVQTPTLALVVRREQAIRSFKPEPYWEVTAQFATAQGDGYSGRWHGAVGPRLPDEAAAAAVRDRVAAAGAGQVESVETKEAVERPPQLYDLTTLQREANRRYGLTAATTLKAAQALYEQKLITYPRTDSRYLSRDVARQVERPLAALARMEPYRALVAQANPQGIWKPRVVNDARVTDHHAIIPTGEAVPTLTGTTAKIFDLVARRFLAQFYPDARFREMEVWTRVGEDRFRSRGRVLLEAGWQVADPPLRRGRKGKGDQQGEEETAPLPPLQEGEAVAVHEVTSHQKETEPPRRYTEASLLAAMETAGKEIEEPELREAMKGRGLGTPATRAAIIERLKQVGYLKAQGKALHPTAKGEWLVALAEAAGTGVLLSAELTGEWERRIADIQAGAYDPAQFQQEMRDLTIEMVEHVRFAAVTGAAQGLRPPTPAGEEEGSTAARTASRGQSGKGGRRGAQESARGGARKSGTATGKSPRQRGSPARGQVAAALVRGEPLPAPGDTPETAPHGEAPGQPPGQGAGPGAAPDPSGTPAEMPSLDRPPEGVRAGTCPRCGSPVIRQAGEWRCQGPGCRVRIPGQLCGRPIPLDEAGLLLREGRTPLLEGFTSRKGRPFSAYLSLGADGVSFEFPNNPRRGRQGPRRR